MVVVPPYSLRADPERERLKKPLAMTTGLCTPKHSVRRLHKPAFMRREKYNRGYERGRKRERGKRRERKGKGEREKGKRRERN